MAMAKISLKDIRWDYLSEEGRSWLENHQEGILTGRTVKESFKRRVMYSEGIYLKEVHYRGVAKLFKSLGGGTACKEGRISRELAKRGISAPEVLGYGRDIAGGLVRRDVLLTREVADGKTLFDFFHQDFPCIAFGEKRKFIRSFAAFVRKLHDVGALHSDLHIGNILFVNEGGDFRFILLDNDRLSLKKNGISMHQTIRNLASILSNLRFHLNRNHYLRFLREYGIPSDKERRAFLVDLQKKSTAHMTKICNGKARRCLTNNSRFNKERRHGFTIYRKSGLPAKNLVDALLPDPDRMLEEGEIFKAGRTVRASRITIEGRSYFLKRYNCKGFIYRFRNAFRRSRAVRTWLLTWGFLARGIPVPEPIACIEERRGRLLGRSYILSTFIQDSEPLKDVWPKLEAGRQKEFLTRIAILMGRMHSYGCLHRDLKWNNVLVSKSEEIVLVDLDGSRVCNRLEIEDIKRDMSRFQRDLSSRQVSIETENFFLACWRRWAMALHSESKP